MESLNETKLKKMFNVAKSIEHLNKRGVDSRHLIKDTIHLRHDGSGIQLKLLGGKGGIQQLNIGEGISSDENGFLKNVIIGNHSFKKGKKSYGSGIGETLTPYLIHLSPLIVRSLMKVINGEVRSKEEIKKELGTFGEKALSQSLDKFIANKITGALEPAKVQPIVKPVMGPPTELRTRGFRTI